MQPLTETKSQRIEVIDVLRGITLLGIILVHFGEQYYAGMAPKIHENFTNHHLADNIVSGLIGFFVSGKFYMIFSFLFGLSFFIQLSRNDNESSFIIRFIWRIFILFVIGFIHHLHYRGDILSIYAVLAVGLVFFYRLTDRWLFMIALLLVFNVPGIITRAINAFSENPKPEFFENMDQKQLEIYYDTLKSGTYVEILKANFYELLPKFEMQVAIGRFYITLGLFLLGICAGRKNVFADIKFFKKLLRISLWTLLGCFLFALAFFGGTTLAKITLPQNIQFLVGGAVFDIFNAAQASVYVSAVILLFQKEKWRSRLMHFYAVGRMGLTTYLTQTLIGIFIFFSFGLSLLGVIGTAVTASIAIVVFILQIIFCKWWLQKFNYGPVEWLWRSLTYLKIQKLKRD